GQHGQRHRSVHRRRDDARIGALRRRDSVLSRRPRAMKILHTSDWHIGKVLKGQPRTEEQLAALAAVVEAAHAERPDLIVMAGDLYDNGAPTPEATKIVTRALSALRKTGAEVIVIAGNHDNGPALDALRVWADAAGVTLRGRISDRPADHIISGVTKSGEPW